jgi:hypothetical protein
LRFHKAYYCERLEDLKLLLRSLHEHAVDYEALRAHPKDDDDGQGV